MAVFLEQLTEAIGLLRGTRSAVSVVSLYGAGGTSAALGSDAHAVRVEMGRRLGLGITPVSWHVARDRLVRFGTACGLVATIASRFAREVIGLSRTEIGELREAEGYLHGASSTMPQKVNPVQSEAIVGFAATAQSLVPALYRSMEATHERATGEWQIEWTVLPQIAISSASALSLGVDVASGLVVDAGRMRKAMEDDKWMLMAEAYMMGLAPYCGRERAHDIVYHAASRARESAADLSSELVRELDADGLGELSVRIESMIAPESYLGDVLDQCASSRLAWRRSANGDLTDDVRALTSDLETPGHE
jgi:3-carboxy-cis,cis-muconate cycloisomerase